MVTKKLMNVAESLKIIIKASEDDIMLAARNELQDSDNNAIQKAIEVIGEYYQASRIFDEEVEFTETLAEYLPLAAILDDQFVHDKYLYYQEESQIFEEEQQKRKKLQELWAAMIQFNVPAKTSLAASDQSADDMMNELAHSDENELKFSNGVASEDYLALKIKCVDNYIKFILDSENETKLEKIVSVTMQGKEIPIINGVGYSDIDKILPPDFTITVTDSNGEKYYLKLEL